MEADSRGLPTRLDDAIMPWVLTDEDGFFELQLDGRPGFWSCTPRPTVGCARRAARSAGAGRCRARDRASARRFESSAACGSMRDPTRDASCSLRRVATVTSFGVRSTKRATTPCRPCIRGRGRWPRRTPSQVLAGAQRSRWRPTRSNGRSRSGKVSRRASTSTYAPQPRSKPSRGACSSAEKLPEDGAWASSGPTLGVVPGSRRTAASRSPALRGPPSSSSGWGRAGM